MENVKLKIGLRTFVLFITLCTAAYFIITGRYTYFLLLGPLILYQLYLLYRSQFMLYKEVEQFSQALFYRDFSRNFNTNSIAELTPLYRNFNEINRMFQQVSRDKETQYQYLQKILELVNTGILSYETESGEVIWMNESLRMMLDRPYIKNIHSLAKRDESLFCEIMALKPGESKIVAIETRKLS
ncbi:MAG TPA: ATP-binding protein, partial [Daejeonella sp.]